MPSTYHYANEAIIDPLEAIYIAVPKTGSSSVRSQLQLQGTPFFPQPHLNIRQVRQVMQAFALYCSLGQRRDFQMACDPRHEDVVATCEGSFQRYFKFASVRNPWARAVSLYFRREGVQLSGQISFDAFIDRHLRASDTCLYPTAHDNQLDWITDDEGRIAVDYVYKMEDMAAAFDEIAETTSGRIRLQPKMENRNGASIRRYREMYSDHTRKLVATRFERDIDTFRYVF